MAGNNETDSVHVPSPEHRQFKQLVRYRKNYNRNALVWGLAASLRFHW